MCFRIKRKVFSWFSEFKAFDELVFIQNQIGLASAPRRCDVLNAFADENDFLRVAALLLDISVYKPFDVELPEHEFLPSFVVADHPYILVDLAILVLFLWWIRRCVVDLQKTVVEDEDVCSPRRAVPGLPDLVPAPCSDKESQQGEGIGLGRWLLRQSGTIRVTMRTTVLRTALVTILSQLPFLVC